jgi:eight-cysteine-cluster-containing protein
MKAEKILIALILAAVAVVAGCTATEVDTGNESSIATECVTDSDCTVAGCSGQLCTTTEKAADTITTCEYREEFSCITKTNCGCVQGKCGWAETPEYEKCIESAMGKK